MKAILIESLKEGLRVFLIATLPILIMQLEAQEFNWEVLLYTGLIAVIKALDKALHEYKKEEGVEGTYKGLIGF